MDPSVSSHPSLLSGIACNDNHGGAHPFFLQEQRRLLSSGGGSLVSSGVNNDTLLSESEYLALRSAGNANNEIIYSINASPALGALNVAFPQYTTSTPQDQLAIAAGRGTYFANNRLSGIPAAQPRQQQLGAPELQGSFLARYPPPHYPSLPTSIMIDADTGRQVRVVNAAALSDPTAMSSIPQNRRRQDFSEQQGYNILSRSGYGVTPNNHQLAASAAAPSSLPITSAAASYMTTGGRITVGPASATLLQPSRWLLDPLAPTQDLGRSLAPSLIQVGHKKRMIRASVSTML
jgi:hypothetical protein